MLLCKTAQKWIKRAEVLWDLYNGLDVLIAVLQALGFIALPGMWPRLFIQIVGWLIIHQATARIIGQLLRRILKLCFSG